MEFTNKASAQHAVRSVVELRSHIALLELEWLEAETTGLIECEPYRRHLKREMAECGRAFVVAAVGEIARLRADLSGSQPCAYLS